MALALSKEAAVIGGKTVAPAASAVVAGGLGLAGAALTGKEKSKGFMVPPGFAAIRLGLDRLPKKDRNGNYIIKGPGFHPYALFLRSSLFISVQDKVNSLGQIELDRNGLTIVEGEVLWGVSPEDDNPVKAAFGPAAGELGSLVVSTCTNAFRNIMSAVPADALQSKGIDWDADDEEVIKAGLHARQEVVDKVYRHMGHLCAERLGTWGAELRGLNIKVDAPHPYRSIPTGAPAAAVLGNGHLEAQQSAGSAA